MNGGPWTEDDRALLRKYWCDLSTREIAEALGRTPESVKVQAAKLGIFRQRRNTMVDKERDKEYMRRLN